MKIAIDSCSTSPAPGRACRSRRSSRGPARAGAGGLPAVGAVPARRPASVRDVNTPPSGPSFFAADEASQDPCTLAMPQQEPCPSSTGARPSAARPAPVECPGRRGPVPPRGRPRSVRRRGGPRDGRRRDQEPHPSLRRTRLAGVDVAPPATGRRRAVRSPYALAVTLKRPGPSPAGTGSGPGPPPTCTGSAPDPSPTRTACAPVPDRAATDRAPVVKGAAGGARHLDRNPCPDAAAGVPKPAGVPSVGPTEPGPAIRPRPVRTAGTAAHGTGGRAIAPSQFAGAIGALSSQSLYRCLLQAGLGNP